MKFLIVFLLFFTGIISVKGQFNDENHWEIVLEKAITDSTFIFGKRTEDGGTETRLTYFGKVTTKHNQTFKVMNSSWHWGLSHRATSRILIFTEDNKYVGNYYVTTVSDLPTKMREGKLIFENIDNDCDKKVVSEVNLKNGLPEKFYRKCENEFGDVYSFE